MAIAKSKGRKLEGELGFRAHVVRQRERLSINREIRGTTYSNFWLDSQIPDSEVGEIVAQCLRNIDQRTSVNLNQITLGGGYSFSEDKEKE